MDIFTPADILIPQNCSFEKWSVVACDQYTSEREYWEETRRTVGDAPSSLNVIFPETYLGDEDGDKRIADINKTMLAYKKIMRELPQAFIYVERRQSDGRVRKGIIGKIDLEQYDFSIGSQSAIRATEGTVASRIPPRVKIRKDAALELPHILMLIDDRQRTVIEPIADKKSELECLYDFDLMQGGGHLTGYLIKKELNAVVTAAVNALGDREAFCQKYGVLDKGTLVIAVGDGNHSLAAAKTCWENIKKELPENERQTHPARYALVELNNIHDSALEFEPIQRVVYGVEPKKMIAAFGKYYPDASFEDNGGHKIEYVFAEGSGTIYVKNPPSNLPVGTLQKFIDDYIRENGGSVDYIHGNDVVKRLARQKNAVGFMVAPMQKNDLFASVIKDGALPRKTFSMGESADKRYYLEARCIK